MMMIMLVGALAGVAIAIVYSAFRLIFGAIASKEAASEWDRGVAEIMTFIKQTLLIIAAGFILYAAWAIIAHSR